MGEATGDWLAGFLAALTAGSGAAVPDQTEAFLDCLPPGYREQTAPGEAARDCAELWAGYPGGTGFRASTAAGQLRLRRASWERSELSDLLPLLESFGLSVVEAVPWHFPFRQGRAAGHAGYVDDVLLRVSTAMLGPGTAAAPYYDGDEATGPPAALTERFIAGLRAVMGGDAELGPLNHLVIGAGLDWRDVNLLAAYHAYRRLVGGLRAADKAELLSSALVAFPAVARSTVALAAARLGAPGQVVGAAGSVEGAESGLDAALADVPDLAHYQALAELAALVRATTRSSWGLCKPTIALKLQSGAVDFLPPPRPLTETFVWSPRFEAVHLRFGLVARGGIRWSERRSDLRSEVLGLAKAQVKKNSLIVPTGAKGGFVLAGSNAGDPTAGADAYRSFMESLLDITDNISAGAVIAPAGVRRLDGDDPYLVVAADKGTAAFSDLANSVSAGRAFWLGDAFASGGSRGYDHKALGITARGAWVAVRHHFRSLGLDPQSDPLRVVGVGDMSGDVFGNAMLQSRAICLVAAFDHRHIFVDPVPRPELSYEERRRLSQLPRSSWADYDTGALSPGGAVFSRQARQVELSAEAAAALGARRGPQSPAALVQAVLRAPVDMIFFGGIGTFVKAATENDAEVDDRANDEVRINADQLRARVVAEGANLALTQRARAAYSRRGGRVNADFVDNAGGVAMSDQEVNLKVLLGSAIATGRLDAMARDQLLSGAADEVSQAVLEQVELGVAAVDGAARDSAAALGVYESLMEDLEAGGALDRAVEALPAPEEMGRRAAAGAGFSRPELAVLIAYARSELARSLERSAVVGGPAGATRALGYFPTTLAARFADLVPSHPLSRELVASGVANEVIGRMGPIWAHELASETGGDLADVAAAYEAASQVLRAAAVAKAIEAAAGELTEEQEAELKAAWSAAVDRLARWYLARTWDSPAGAGAYSGGAYGGDAEMQDGGSRVVGGGYARADGPAERVPAFAALAAQDIAVADALDDPRGGDLVGGLAAGAPGEVATSVSRMWARSAAGPVAAIARRTGRSVREAAQAHAEARDTLGSGTAEERLRQWTAADRWQRWQLHRLGDDLTWAQAEAAAQALLEEPGLAPPEAVAAWARARPRLLAQSRALAAKWQSTGTPSLSLAALAVRALADAVRL